MGCASSLSLFSCCTAPVEPQPVDTGQQKDCAVFDMQRNTDNLVQWDRSFSSTLFEIETKIKTLSKTVAHSVKPTTLKSVHVKPRHPLVLDEQSPEQIAIHNISNMTNKLVVWVDAYHKSLQDARDAVTNVVALTSLNPTDDTCSTTVKHNTLANDGKALTVQSNRCGTQNPCGTHNRCGT